MSEERWSEIEASLRHRFEPPPLEALERRIAEAAAEPPRADDSGGQVLAMRQATSAPAWRRSVGLAMAVAAAIVLVWLLGSRPAPGTASEAAPDSKIAMASSRVAGEQLDAFLDAARSLPPLDADCAMVEAPPSCDGTEQQPQIQPDLDVRVLGECGGATAIACADHGLPAQRALIVQLEPSGVEAIVCIEPPWADPKPVLPEASDYNIFRRKVGTYVLYEVTPLPAPQALALFSIPG